MIELYIRFRLLPVYGEQIEIRVKNPIICTKHLKPFANLETKVIGIIIMPSNYSEKFHLCIFVIKLFLRLDYLIIML